jgi:hypothetical protein
LASRAVVVRTFGIALGDVCINRGDQEELAVCSGWMLTDGSLRAAIWLGTDRTSLLTTDDRRWWMTRVDAAEYMGLEVPATIELMGQVLRRTRRLPVHVECAGGEIFGASAAILGEYEDRAGKVAVLLACGTAAVAFMGSPLGAHDLEVWEAAGD